MFSLLSGCHCCLDSIQWTRAGNTRMCMQYTYLIHTNINICIYFCIYLCMLKTMYSHQHLQVLSSFWVGYNFTLFMFVTPLMSPSMFSYFMHLCPSINSALTGSDALGLWSLDWLLTCKPVIPCLGLLHTWLLSSSPCSDLSPCSGHKRTPCPLSWMFYLVILHLTV